MRYPSEKSVAKRGSDYFFRIGTFVQPDIGRLWSASWIGSVVRWCGQYNGRFHCVDTLRMAVERFGKPEIFNSDQGRQFISAEFFGELRNYGVKISMDGRARCLDNAKMKRFWWAVKYEDIKIKEYVSLPQLRFGVQHEISFWGRVLTSCFLLNSIFLGTQSPHRGHSLCSIVYIANKFVCS